MPFLKEFKDFAVKGNVLDLAVAVIIGGAFGKIVTAFVGDLVMPLVNAVMPQGDWRKWEATPLHFKVGDFIGTLVDFIVVALVVFIVVVKVMGTAKQRFLRGPGDAPAAKTCPECLELVPAAARRCRACTSVLAGVSPAPSS
jgi:large conductance mechanosensitive channel